MPDLFLGDESAVLKTEFWHDISHTYKCCSIFRVHFRSCVIYELYTNSFCLYFCRKPRSCSYTRVAPLLVATLHFHKRQFPSNQGRYFGFCRARKRLATLFFGDSCAFARTARTCRLIERKISLISRFLTSAHYQPLSLEVHSRLPSKDQGSNVVSELHFPAVYSSVIYARIC